MTERPSRRDRLAKRDTEALPALSSQPPSSDDDVAVPAEMGARPQVPSATGPVPPLPAERSLRNALAKAATEEVPIEQLVSASSSVGGAYELRRTIAEGSFGSVVEALDRRSGRVVALKLLKKEVAPLEIARFEREAETAKRLSHPGLVRALESGTLDGAPYIAFELVPGPDLDARVREKGPLGEREALEVARGLARALAHAHDKGVLHRDVSPRNVILVEEPGKGVRPVLADFGLAKDLLAQDVLTRTGDVLGTPVTMAPEVIRGGASRADERADIFGLGAVLYYAITGRVPFQAKSLEELATLVEQGTEPPANVSSQTAAFLATALATKKEDRPPTALRCAQMIEEAIAELPKTSGKPPAPPAERPATKTPEKELPRGKRKLLIAAALFAIAIAASAAIVIRGRRNLARAEAIDLVSLAASSLDKTPIEQARDATRAIALAPSYERAYALRAFAHARLGDLPLAESDLAQAGDDDLAKRARAWILFRQGKVDEALTLIDGTVYRTRDWNTLACSAGREEKAELASAEGGSSFWERNLTGNTARFVTIKANLNALVDLAPGTIESHRALLLRAMKEFVALDEEAADKDVKRALDAPPREKALAEALANRFAALRREGFEDSPGKAPPARSPEAIVLRDAIEDGLEKAIHELDADRFLESATELANATKRLRRLLAFGANGTALRSWTVRALARRPHENEAALRRFATELEKEPAPFSFEAIRAAFALGDEAHAKELVEKAKEDRSAAGATFVVEASAIANHAGEDAARILGFPVKMAEDLKRCEAVLRSRLLDRPWESLSDLDELGLRGTTRFGIVEAAARVRSDPISALAALARDSLVIRQPTPEVMALARVLAKLFPEDEATIVKRLEPREVPEADARACAKLLQVARPR